MKARLGESKAQTTLSLTIGVLQSIDNLQAAAFTQKDISFIQKIASSDEQYTNLEEAAVREGYECLEDIANRLNVAERFIFELRQISRVRDKLAVLEFWHAYHDEGARLKVRCAALAHSGLTFSLQKHGTSCVLRGCAECMCAAAARIST